MDSLVSPHPLPPLIVISNKKPKGRWNAHDDDYSTLTSKSLCDDACIKMSSKSADTYSFCLQRQAYSFGSDQDFTQLSQVHSMDFSDRQGKAPPRKSAAQVLKEQELKAERAREYRQQLLEQQQQKYDEEVGPMSPGYKREKQSARMKKAKQQQKASDARNATFSECAFNMCNILMGVGLLGLPYVFMSAGWIGGFVVTVFFCFVTWRTSVLIGRELNGDPRPSNFFDDSPFKTPVAPGSAPGARMLPPIKSFPDIARVSFGEAGCFVLSFILYFELFSCLCIFFVTLGDHLNALFPSIPPERHMVFVAVALTIPTAVLRTPKLLSYLSMVGTVATVAVVLSVFLASIIEGDVTEKVAQRKGVDGRPYHILWNAAGLPLALGIVAYTFSGHAIVPSIYSSMERPQDFEKMIDTSFLIVLGCCLVVAIGGYHLFGSLVQDQITISLQNFSSAGLAMDCLTWLMIMTAFSKFTLTMFPLALGLEEIFAPYVPNETATEVVSSLVKLCLIGCALSVAIFVPSFSFLCALVGMVCTMAVSVVFPAAAHLKMFGAKLVMGERLLDWLFVIFGSIVAVVGTIATLQ